MTKKFEEYKILINDKPCIAVSVREDASAQQRLIWLLELAAMIVYDEGLDLQMALESLRAEYENFVAEAAEERKQSRKLYVVK